MHGLMNCASATITAPEMLQKLDAGLHEKDLAQTGSDRKPV